MFHDEPIIRASVVDAWRGPHNSFHLIIGVACFSGRTTNHVERTEGWARNSAQPSQCHLSGGISTNASRTTRNVLNLVQPAESINGELALSNSSLFISNFRLSLRTYFCASDLTITILKKTAFGTKKSLTIAGFTSFTTVQRDLIVSVILNHVHGL
jgi:hypothetical protein